MQNHKLQGSLSSHSIPRLPITIAIISSLTVVGISIFTVVWFRDSSQHKTPVSVPVMPEIKTVTALGRIEPEGEIIKLAATISGEGSRVEKLLIEEGDRVQSGQVIAILDHRDRLQAELTEAQAEVKVAKANLAVIQAGAKPGEIAAQQATIARLTAENRGDIDSQTANIDRLEAEVLNAQTEQERYQKLYTEGAISASQLDSKRLILATAQKNLQAAQAQFKRTQLSNQQQLQAAKATLEKIAQVPDVDIAAAKAQVIRAEARVKKAQVNLAQAYVRSPQNGQILEIRTRPGELVSSDGIVLMGRTNQMYTVAEVYESDISKVQPGQRVRVLSDVLPLELSGTVDRIGLQVRRQNVINTDPSSNVDNRVIKVHIRLDSASSKKAAKLTNMQVRVVIETGEELKIKN
ncbi:MAG TPA: ABC exporter membrane fusion protein [Nostocaceae cyanobacterium]|nr:ABC exporter membrane fusion protein [Nostocaceae cyanobacterium]